MMRRFFSGEKLVGNFFGAVSRLDEVAATMDRAWPKDIGGRTRLAAGGDAGMTSLDLSQSSQRRRHRSA